MLIILPFWPDRLSKKVFAFEDGKISRVKTSHIAVASRPTLNSFLTLWAGPVKNALYLTMSSAMDISNIFNGYFKYFPNSTLIVFVKVLYNGYFHCAEPVLDKFIAALEKEIEGNVKESKMEVEDEII